jgi:phosphopantetheine adenylyltransferase
VLELLTHLILEGDTAFMATAYGLLLLPSPPSPPSPPALRAALDPPLTSALSRLAKLAAASPKGAILDIAVPCPGFCSGGETPAQLFGSVQRLLAGIYSLLAFIYDRDSIDSSGEGVVDTRVLLAYYNPDQDVLFHPLLPPCVVELPRLARSRRRWTHVFVVESEPGEDIYQQFKSFAAGDIGERTSPGWKTERVRGGIQVRIIGGAGPSVRGTESRAAYYGVVNGGAYDHLHFGHKLVLTMTSFLIETSPHSGNTKGPSRIVIGITEEDLLNNERYSQYMETWDARQKNVTNFLLAILDFTPPGIALLEIPQQPEAGPVSKVVITKPYPFLSIEIFAHPDRYGPAIDDETLSALALCGKSGADAKAVNDQRKEKGWRELDVFEVYVVHTESLDTDEDIEKAKSANFATKLSSTETRRKMYETLQGSYLPPKGVPIGITEINGNSLLGM